MGDKPLACAWTGCTEEAQHPRLDKDGKPWAHLCRSHHDRLNAALSGARAGKVLAYWVAAMGGAKAAAKRMTDG